MLPDKGLEYEHVRERLKKNKALKGNVNLQNSMLNQVRIHEGLKAAKELAKEARMDFDNCK